MQAVSAAARETERFRQHMRRVGTRVLRHTLANNGFALVLAGHPYHVDPGISHGIADMVAGMGVTVLTEDSIAHLVTPQHPLRVVNQWTYHARLYRAAALSTLYGRLGMVQFTSFGCGIDAVTSDQVQEILEESGCIFTLLKIDEGTNLGAARIRIRSLLAAERARLARKDSPTPVGIAGTGGTGGTPAMPAGTFASPAAPAPPVGTAGTLGTPAIPAIAFAASARAKSILATPFAALGIPGPASASAALAQTISALADSGPPASAQTVLAFAGAASTAPVRAASAFSVATQDDSLQALSASPPLAQIPPAQIPFGQTSSGQISFEAADKKSPPKFSGVPGQALQGRQKQSPFSGPRLDPVAGGGLPPPDPAQQLRRGGRPLYSELRVPFTKAMRDTHTILIPQFAPIHFQMVEKTVSLDGYKVKLLPAIDKNAIETGLRYVNNDVCYPALMVVGQLIQAVESGEYDADRIALIVSQTGGGCRATNYISFLRKGLANAGLSHVPVLSFNVSGLEEHSGFSVSGPMLGRIVRGSLYGDLLARLFYRVRPYEKEAGQAQATLERLTARCVESLEHTGRKVFSVIVNEVVDAFAAIPVTNEQKPRVGVVGEIYLRLNPDANNNVMDIIEAEGGEAVPGDFANFILYCLYDEVFRAKALAGHWKKALKSHLKIWWIERLRTAMRRALSRHPRFGTIDSLYSLAAITRPVIQLGHQTGEGWLLTAEMIDFINKDIPNIICLQPFGCLPNHVTGKGVIKELKRIYPAANITPVDYDAGASEVNQLNRIKLMMAVAKENLHKQEGAVPEEPPGPLVSPMRDSLQDSTVTMRQGGLPKK